MQKQKTLKYRVTVGTNTKEFRRHRDMKRYVRSLDPNTTIFTTEYWNRRSGLNGAYMPSWEWSSEGQKQYVVNKIAHDCRRAQHVERQLSVKAKAKAEREAKRATVKSEKAVRRAEALEARIAARENAPAIPLEQRQGRAPHPRATAESLADKAKRQKLLQKSMRNKVA